MTATIEQFEDAIIAAVLEAKTEMGVSQLTVKSYQGELDETDMRQITARLPAVYVMYGGSTYAEHGPRKIEKPKFVLFVCDRSLRAEDEARRGGATNPGTYAMLNACRDALCGSQLSLGDDIHPFRVVREYPVWYGGGVSVYAAEYESGQGHLYPTT